MNLYVEWYIATLRAFWYPLIWAWGLEAPSVALPAEYAPGMALNNAEPPYPSKRRAPRKAPGTRAIAAA